MQSNIISRSIANVISRFNVKSTDMLRAFTDATQQCWRLNLCAGPLSAKHFGTQGAFWNVSAVSVGMNGSYLPHAVEPAPQLTSTLVLRPLFQRLS